MDEKGCTQVDAIVVDVFFPQAKIFNITNIPDNQIFQTTTDRINCFNQLKMWWAVIVSKRHYSVEN